MVIYKCDICKKICNDKTQFIKHINRKFPCTSPSVEVSNSSQQLQNNSNNTQQFQESLDNSESIKCDFCNKEFSNKYNLNKHIHLNRCKNTNLDILKLQCENLNNKINLFEYNKQNNKINLLEYNKQNNKINLLENNKYNNKQNNNIVIKSEIVETNDVSIINKENILDDDILIQKIKSKFNSNDMQIFEFARDRKML